MLCLIKLAASTTTQGRNQCSLDLKHVPTCKHSCLGASGLVAEGSHSQTHPLQPSEKQFRIHRATAGPREPSSHGAPPPGLPGPSSRTWGISHVPEHTLHSQAAHHITLSLLLSSLNLLVHKVCPHPTDFSLTLVTTVQVSVLISVIVFPILILPPLQPLTLLVSYFALTSHPVPTSGVLATTPYIFFLGPLGI